MKPCVPVLLQHRQKSILIYEQGSFEIEEQEIHLLRQYILSGLYSDYSDFESTEMSTEQLKKI